jgi:exodeoxyribonuclease VII large subunit
MDDTLRTFTVTEAVGAVRTALERELGEVRVRGEISNFKEAVSGHLYFTLKDDRSQLRAVMFKGSTWGLRFLPADGLEVEADGEVTVYEPRGDLQLLIRRMAPAGQGALMQAFERLKRKLEAEGLFAAERKRPLPRFPRAVAVVTSPRGAAVRDLLHVLERRWPPAEVVVVPVPVQGEGAAEAIARGLDRVSASGAADVVIVGRGGGSLEDLWAFNEEVVARAIARCRVPVISAVGHETDTTIADFAADVRAPTPSAAAEIAVPDRREILALFASAGGRLHRCLAALVTDRLRTVSALARAYGFRRPEEFLRRDQQHLDHLAHRLGRSAHAALTGARGRADALGRRMDRVHPETRIAAERRELSHRRRLLARLAADRAARLGARVRESSRALAALDPTRVLERGFCLVRRGSRGTIVTAAAGLEAGAAVTLQFHEDRASAVVEAVEPGGLLHPSPGDAES